MPRASHTDAISQAVTDICGIESMDQLSQAAINHGIILRLLSAAGWNVFNLSEVEPDYRTGRNKVDFALKSPPAGRSRGASTPKVLIDVRSLSDNLESERYQRQLTSHCVREGASLAALTNGPTWILLFCSDDGQEERRFCDIDLIGNPDRAKEDINRYLSKDRVSSGQAARSAERVLLDRSRDETARSAVLNAWRQVVEGFDEGLIELVATAAEQKLGARPDNRFARRVLMESRAELMTSGDGEGASSASRSTGSRRRPASFTFQGETREVSSWPDLLRGVCLMIRDLHPDEFEKILEIRGRTLPYFSKFEEQVNMPRQVGDTGIYASCQGAGVLVEGRARKVTELFGYPRSSLTIQTR